MYGGDIGYQILNIFKCYAIRSLNVSLKIEKQIWLRMKCTEILGEKQKLTDYSQTR